MRVFKIVKTFEVELDCFDSDDSSEVRKLIMELSDHLRDEFRSRLGSVLKSLDKEGERVRTKSELYY